MVYLNLTPHAIALNDGREFPPSGIVARVTQQWGEPMDLGDGHTLCIPTYGEVTDLPAPQQGFVYILSGMACEAARASGRTDVVCPATGHPDTKRNEKGHIVSVPCWA